MSEPIEIRRKRLIHRSLYTGMKETDLLLGGFARAHLPDFDATMLDQYEALLDTNEDPQIYAWAIGREPVPAEFDTPVMRLLKSYIPPR
ncbi:succinate dehydrogenase assembly factor 2 [Ferrovibrio sp. MS7]|jgi:antitoxin CptB|uniref:FAD assembly factor SdhE n=1 Tax=Ferrovibrio plantarum TaxID=3119164 RepID=UPI001B750986|nr:succinate dehydrogenase assembly factor 2 [Ferrovibrio sp.]